MEKKENINRILLKRDVFCLHPSVWLLQYNTPHETPACIVNRTYSSRTIQVSQKLIFLWTKKKYLFRQRGHCCEWILQHKKNGFTAIIFWWLFLILVPCPRVANHIVSLVGWKDISPQITKVSTELHSTVKRTKVSTVTDKKAKILLLANYRSWREVRKPSDAVLSHSLDPFFPKMVNPVCYWLLTPHLS